MRVSLFGSRYTSEELRRDPVKRRRALRTMAVALAVGALISAGSLAYGFVHERPLRGQGLEAAQGQVLDMQYRRRGTDRVQVRYTPTGLAPLTRRIAVTAPFEEGATVDLLYAPEDPELVRTVRDWRSAWTPAGLLFPVGIAAVAGMCAAAARRTRV